MSKKKILITGSNGLLGQKLVSLLANHADIHLIATARGNNRLSFTDGYEYQEMDITNAEQVAEVIERIQPNAIIHTAAMTNVDQCEFEKDLCWAMNVKAVEYLAEVCEKHNIYLCHLSTDFVFDGSAGPYSEEAQPSPVSYYGWTKYAAEEVVRRSTCRWSIARTVLVYGIVSDMSRSNIILWVKKSLEEGKSIKVVTDQFRTPTLAEDLAKGCWLMTDKEAEGIFHISGKDFLTPYEMAIKTADFFQLDKSLISTANSSNFTQPAKRPPRTGFILDKAISVLGYNPVSFDEGIAIVAEQTEALL
ncbi:MULTISPECIES: NAD(P)-dependent oxidoreductase [unclassified Arcicella]|uniref:SDR family oxidoreductase n=1 Tax=unclassified Arcicella TaxID=2644986 RepID=UPI00285CEA13|nr:MULTISPECIES: NAD(P)-dependent oxidoreductase [unclassified Arcicella]MDR6560540.1 dTDP-4-dehydrorhamnose reductase [Arcicella sp. BE51]MDR6809854.1 dTDP-4-dehydrorhamnose reductase [Arcicella sp. BE140]MDR6821203.1 dTDP-4-dehydrorhamnose reductase [Arcicella sp. BE139]